MLKPVCLDASAAPLASCARRSVKDSPTGETMDKEDADELKRPPENKQQVLLRVNFEGLPSTGPDSDEAIAQLLNIKYETLVQIFAHTATSISITALLY